MISSNLNTGEGVEIHRIKSSWHGIGIPSLQADFAQKIDKPQSFEVITFSRGVQRDFWSVLQADPATGICPCPPVHCSTFPMPPIKTSHCFYILILNTALSLCHKKPIFLLTNWFSPWPALWFVQSPVGFVPFCNIRAPWKIHGAWGTSLNPQILDNSCHWNRNRFGFCHVGIFPSLPKTLSAVSLPPNPTRGIKAIKTLWNRLCNLDFIQWHKHLITNICFSLNSNYQI